MGLAASQARFLQLTARRSNIEYQGQQINQQRLALANASAGLFEKMLTLEPPTPPSSQDDKYYTQGYTFQDKNDSTIQKKISWSNTQPTAAEILKAITGSTVADPTTDPAAMTAQITVSTATGSVQISAAALAGVAGAGGTQTSAIGDMMAAQGTASGSGSTQTIRNVTIEHAIYDPDGNYQTVQESGVALLEFDNLNRLINATMLNGTSNTGISTKTADKGTSKDTTIGKGDSLTYASVFDSTTYQNDVNKYEFEKASYDYQIERINQQTKEVQTQDKSLELKMKQLDTEHNAVQTEMDAVQKVIQKNVESSFKTFA